MNFAMRMPLRTGLLLVFLAFIRTDGYSQAGNSGLAFLKLGVGGRGVAMGDAMSASVQGAPATYYNPAGLLSSSDTCSSVQLMFTHKEWVQDTRAEFLGGAVRISDNHALGISINSTTTSDIEIRTRPGPADGTFTARDFSAGLSYAYGFSDNLQLGTTLKFLYEKIFVDETTGFAVDFGAQYRPPVEHLVIGFMLANLGGTKDLRNEAIKLPALLRIGPAYAVPVESAQSVVTVGADFVRIFPEHRNYLDLGGEFFFNHVVAGRAGYQFGSEGRGLSAGIGLQYGIFIVDYAYAPLSSDLGNTHTISLALNL
jgi:hypothetical protein